MPPLNKLPFPVKLILVGFPSFIPILFSLGCFDTVSLKNSTAAFFKPTTTFCFSTAFDSNLIFLLFLSLASISKLFEPGTILTFLNPFPLTYLPL